jgi:hypothetical protein
VGGGPDCSHADGGFCSPDLGCGLFLRHDFEFSPNDTFHEAENRNETRLGGSAGQILGQVSNLPWLTRIH